MTGSPRLDHVCLSVADLDTQRRWYTAAFGFTEFLAVDAPHLGIRGISLAAPDGFAIELLEQSGSRPGPRPQTMEESLITQGWAHLCLRVDDVSAMHAHLMDAGAVSRLPPTESPVEPGTEMAYLADPEGNLIELKGRRQPMPVRR